MSNYPNVIGLGGRLTAGKDVVADYLVKKYGYTKQGMSDVLAAAVYELDPIVQGTGGDETDWRYREAIDEYGYTKAKELFPEVRRLLQVFGTEVGRNMFGENFWVDRAEDRIHAVDGPVVLTGIRYPNELDLIHRLGISWWIDRPGTGGDSHTSETSVSGVNFDRMVSNNGTIEQLHALVSYMMER